MGDPWERPVEKVVIDVRRDLLTVEAARLIYGVVVDAATLAVDEAATAKLRSVLPSQRYQAVINDDTLDIEIKPVARKEGGAQ